jgi:hypothetical protein
MAATGLLGINPYQKGINLDITSKPANLAIQLAQKEQAKQEALDKYLMDYEKTLNPNGMRQQDQNAFLSKLGEAKQYYLQNRDKILNPAKYGAEYQSNYYAGLRDAQNSIGQSKQAMAQDKLATQHYIAQKDLNAPDGYAEAVELSHLPISDPRYRPLDVTQWKFYKSHDPMEYANKVYSKIPLSESAPEILDVKGRPGYIYSKTISKIAPENYGRVLQDGYNSFETDEGLRKTMINMFADKEKVKELELKYNTKIPTPKALAGVYTLDLQPIKENTTNAVESGASREARARRNMDYNKNQFAPVRNLLDDVASVKNITNLTKDFTLSKGVVLGKEGKPFTGDISNISGQNIPPDIFTVLGNYKINIYPKDKFKLIVKDGRIQGLQTKTGQIIDRGTIESAQRKYDTERKGEPGLYSDQQATEDVDIDLSNFDLSKIKK